MKKEVKIRINLEVLRTLIILNKEYTYKELCDMGLFYDGYKGGKAKELQIDDLKRFCNVDKDKTKYTISEIYEKPIEKIDMRGSKGKYSDNIQELLLLALYKSKEECEVYWSTSTILEKVKMINSDYIKYRKNMKKLSDEVDINREYISDFYKSNHSDMRDKIESALGTLRKRSLIIYEKTTIVNKTKVYIELNELGEPRLNSNGEVIISKMEEVRKATKEEKVLILRAEKKAMRELGFEEVKKNGKKYTHGDIVAKGLWKEFTEIVSKNISSNNINYSYEAYSITFDKDNIKGELIGELSEQIATNELNNDICECLINGAETRHNNALESDGIFTIKCLSEDKDEKPSEISQKIHNLRISDDYVNSNVVLVQKLIKTK